MTGSHEDRTVHAVACDGTAIVRYDRAGKWYLEHPARKRKAVPLSEAVNAALLPGSRVFEHLPGGMAFHARLERAKRSIT